MKLTKYAGASALIAATLAFTGCTQDQQKLSHTNSYSKKADKHVTNKDKLYAMGREDGCSSAKGIVNQGLRNGNELTYQYNMDYKDGFRRGQESCKNSGSQYGMSADKLYRTGVTDGCSSAKGIVNEGMRNGNEQKYGYNKNYKKGWDEGVAACTNTK
jgi:hypothetical protein